MIPTHDYLRFRSLNSWIGLSLVNVCGIVILSSRFTSITFRPIILQQSTTSPPSYMVDNRSWLLTPWTPKARLILSVMNVALDWQSLRAYHSSSFSAFSYLDTKTGTIRLWSWLNSWPLTPQTIVHLLDAGCVLTRGTHNLCLAFIFLCHMGIF